MKRGEMPAMSMVVMLIIFILIIVFGILFVGRIKDSLL